MRTLDRPSVRKPPLMAAHCGDANHKAYYPAFISSPSASPDGWPGVNVGATAWALKAWGQPCYRRCCPERHRQWLIATSCRNRRDWRRHCWTGRISWRLPFRPSGPRPWTSAGKTSTWDLRWDLQAESRSAYWKRLAHRRGRVPRALCTHHRFHSSAGLEKEPLELRERRAEVGLRAPVFDNNLTTTPMALGGSYVPYWCD